MDVIVEHANNIAMVIYATCLKQRNVGGMLATEHNLTYLYNN